MKGSKRKAYVVLDETFVPWSLCMSKWAATRRVKALVKLTRGDNEFHVMDVPLDADMFLARKYRGGHWLISTGEHGQLTPIQESPIPLTRSTSILD